MLEWDGHALLSRMQPHGSREDRMKRVVDELWNELGDKGCSWVGFYLRTESAEELILGPCRDKPACSPIGVHGACGRALNSKRPLVVTNVSNLRAGYIACDPRDRSELVVPCLESGSDNCWGVLDLDSHSYNAFSELDAGAITRLLVHMGLHIPQGLAAEVI